MIYGWNTDIPLLIVFVFIVLEFGIFINGSKAKKKLKQLDLYHINKIIIENFKVEFIEKEHISLSPTFILNKTSEVLYYKKLLVTISSKANTLIQIGLLGTFFGLSLMISFMLYKTNDSIGTDLSSILSGGISFFSSLFGLALSICLRFGYDNFIHRYTEFEKETLYRMDHIKAENYNHNSQQNNLMMAKAFTKSLTTPIERLIFEVSEYTKSIDYHLKSVSSELPKVIVRLKNEIADINSEHSETLNKFSKDVAESSSIIIKVINNLDIARKRMETTLQVNDEFQDVFENISSSIETTSLIMKEQSTEFNKAIDNMNSAINSSQELNSLIMDNNNKVNSDTLKVNKSISETFIIAKEVTDALKKLPSEFSEQINVNAQKQLNSAINDFSKKILNLSNIIDAMNTSINDKLNEFGQHLSYSLNPSLLSNNGGNNSTNEQGANVEHKLVSNKE